MPLVRSLVAILLGAIAGFAAVMLVEMLSSALYPLPPGVDPSNPQDMRELFSRLAPGAIALVLLAHALGAFVGGFVAAWRAPSRPMVHGLVVGALVLAAGIVNLVALPHPVWFAVVDVALFPLLAFLGARLAPRQARPA